jgi:STE24 endopeptidase
MNLLAGVILSALLANYTLHLLADRLNLRSQTSDVPWLFKSVYDPRRYRQSQDYLRVHTRFGWVAKSYDLALLLMFWFCGGFGWLDQWSRSWGWGEVPTGIIYIAVIGLVSAAATLPLEIYNTFHIEARFGFNKTTWKTFVMDQLKALVLTGLIGTPLLAAILALLHYSGSQAWWYCWVVSAAYLLVVQFVAPTWILPWFNKFEPLPAGELRNAIVTYAQSIDFALDNILVMDGSRRSLKSNAFFTGFGHHRRIVLFDTLIEKHPVNELRAILAHEMGHYKRGHIVQMLAVGIAQMGLLFYVLSFFLTIPSLFEAFYVRNVSVHAGLVFFGILFAPLELLLGTIHQFISRRNEYQADRFAIQTTGDGGAMIEALKKLSAHNLSNLTPHWFYVWLHYSHPPVIERIEAIDRLGTH